MSRLVGSPVKFPASKLNLDDYGVYQDLRTTSGLPDTRPNREEHFYVPLRRFMMQTLWQLASEAQTIWLAKLNSEVLTCAVDSE